MLPERPRARRYPVAASIELIDIESEAAMKARTLDLSLFGCFVKAANPWSIGTRVRMKISYKGAAFTAFGHVTNLRGNGMGIAFSQIAPKDETVLEICMAELRSEVMRA
jgi:PilZ domain